MNLVNGRKYDLMLEKELEMKNSDENDGNE